MFSSFILGTIGIFFVLKTFAAQTNNSKTYIFSLRSYVEKAVEQSLDLKIQGKSLEISHAQLKTRARFYLPKLNLSAQLGLREGAPRYPIEPETSQLSLELNSLLFDNGRSIALWKEAAFQEEKEKINFAKRRDEVSLDAAKRFLEHEKITRNRAMNLQMLKVVDDQARVIRTLYRQGLRTRKDYLRFEGQLLREQIKIDQSELELAKSLSTLYELTPQLRAAGFQISDSTNIPSPQKMSENLFSEHRDKQIWNLNENIRESKFSAERETWWPDLRLNAKGTYQTNDYLGRDSSSLRREQREMGIYLMASWKLWDWGESSRKNANLRREFEIQKLTDQKTEQVLLSTLDELKEKNSKAIKFLEQSKKLLEFERSNYQLMSLEYRQGKSTVLDLISGLQSLSSAEALHLEYEIEFKKLQFEILFHQGGLYESLQGGLYE